MKKTKENKTYWPENYQPKNKNCKSVIVNGITYLSKVQAMAMEGMTRKELDEYLKNADNQ